jgi:hypothetical protein
MSQKAHVLFEVRSHGKEITRTADLLELCKVILLTLTKYVHPGGADTAPADPRRGAPKDR